LDDLKCRSPWMTDKDPKEIGFGLYW